MKFILLFSLIIPTTVFASSSWVLETGVVDNTYNKVRIPGDEGTLFNLVSAFNETEYFYRLSFLHSFESRHGLRLLLAPLEVSGSKSFSKDINFQGATFSSNEKTKAYYKFNSYRASYFYQLFDEKDFHLNLGATLKVRDAKIELEQNSIKKSRSDLGLVPLLYLYSEYKWDNGARLVFDFDGLAAPQGRAFDMALMLGYYFNSSYQLSLGYRILEGGVDNDKVYNFSQFNYLFTSLRMDF